jgi:hypothetical protein
MRLLSTGSVSQPCAPWCWQGPWLGPSVCSCTGKQHKVAAGLGHGENRPAQHHVQPQSRGHVPRKGGRCQP